MPNNSDTSICLYVESTSELNPFRNVLVLLVSRVSISLHFARPEGMQRVDTKSRKRVGKRKFEKTWNRIRQTKWHVTQPACVCVEGGQVTHDESINRKHKLFPSLSFNLSLVTSTLHSRALDSLPCWCSLEKLLDFLHSTSRRGEKRANSIWENF